MSRLPRLCVLIALTIALVVVAFAVGSAPGSIAIAQESIERPVVLYEAPMLTEVIDPFRPPAHIGGPGNRGLEYANSSRRLVAAAAEGQVTHAGSVAGTNTVTIEHGDGIRTTYTGLLEIWVEEGAMVDQAEFVGRADDGFHFGARLLEHYLDPQVLLDVSRGDLGPGSGGARLVPVSEASQ